MHNCQGASFFANLFFQQVFIECRNYGVKVIFLPLSSMLSVQKEPLFLHWNISKLAETGETESNSENLHLDMYFFFKKKKVFY